MVKKIKKYLKFVVCCALILSLIAPSYAALSASDGSAFVTKAEFDSALADFNARLTTFEAGINSKIDSQVTSYLDRNGIWNGADCPSIRPAGKNYLIFYGGDNPGWTNEYEGERVFFVQSDGGTIVEPLPSMMKGGAMIILSDQRRGETKRFINACSKSGMLISRVCIRYYWNFQYYHTTMVGSEYWVGKFLNDDYLGVDDLITRTNTSGAWYSGIMPCWLKGKYSDGTLGSSSKYFPMTTVAGATIKRTSAGETTNVWETSFNLYTEDWNGDHYYRDDSRANNLRPADETPHVGQLLTFVKKNDILDVSTWLQFNSRDAQNACFALNTTGGTSASYQKGDVYVAVFAFDDLKIY